MKSGGADEVQSLKLGKRENVFLKFKYHFISILADLAGVVTK